MNDELISIMCGHLLKINQHDIAQLNEADRKLFTAMKFACTEKINNRETWNMIRVILYDWLKSGINELVAFASVWYPIVTSSALSEDIYHTVTLQNIIHFKTQNNLTVVVNPKNNGFISKFFGKDVVTTVFISNFNDDNLLVSRLYQINDTNAYDTCKEIHSILSDMRLAKGGNVE